ncbi:MAG: DUF2752 domain-containing protein [Breznakibacter sp.]
MWQQIKTVWRSGKPEGWFWLMAIALLAMSNPDACGHFSLCVFKNLGLGFCPGCGLGHAIALLFRGRIADSLAMHPMGIPAVIILLHRSYRLLIASPSGAAGKEQPVNSNLQ